MSMKTLIRTLKPVARKLPKPVYDFLWRIYRNILDLKLILMPPMISVLPYFQRASLLFKFLRISSSIKCAHTEEQIISFINAFLSIPKLQEGCIVEAGVFKGGGAAKFSLIAKHINRELILFDSYEGLPENKELHEGSMDKKKDS